jgi:hypothetical protein
MNDVINTIRRWITLIAAVAAAVLTALGQLGG